MTTSTDIFITTCIMLAVELEPHTSRTPICSPHWWRDTLPEILQTWSSSPQRYDFYFRYSKPQSK